MSKLDLKYHSTDEGFCRVYYEDRTTKRLYCIQDNGYGGVPKWELCNCSSDGEPESDIPFSRCAAIDVLPGNSKMETQINEFIKEMPKGYD